MIETLTLTTPFRGPSLTFLNDKHRSPSSTLTGKLHFRLNNSCNASLNVIEADPKTRSNSSLYDVLRVNRNATCNEIKAAYRNLAKVYHPDACVLDRSDDGKFIEIHNAYATLCNPADRAMYDFKLNMGLRRPLGSYTTVGTGRGYTSRRWETDQCW